MTIRLSFDTNVLIYAADGGMGDRHHLARALIGRAARAKRAVLTDQSLVELLHAARKKGFMPFRDAIGYVNELTGLFDLVLPKPDTISRTIDTVKRYELSVWDARLIAVCDANDCSVLFSEDMQDHGRYGRVRVVNPFTSANRPIVDEVLSV